MVKRKLGKVFSGVAAFAMSFTMMTTTVFAAPISVDYMLY